MSDKIQYDDEGNAGHWVYVASKNARIFIRDGELLQDSFNRLNLKKEELNKTYQIRKNSEQVTDMSYEYNRIENRFRREAKDTYNKLYDQFNPPSDKELDYTNHKQVEAYAGELIRKHISDVKGNIACYRTAGVIAAIFDKKGWTDYHCYIGASSDKLKMKQIGNFSNHTWIEHNGIFYETFPGYDSDELTYHSSNVEVFFYR